MNSLRSFSLYFSDCLFWVLLFVISISSCKEAHKYKYAITDFKNSLQPCLTNIVSKGILDSDTSLKYLGNHATNQELKFLSKSEHPLLRAAALRIMIEKADFDNYELVMSHLDDTAKIATDAGEFGFEFKTVSDDLIYNSTWKTVQEKRKTIDEVITKHNYLKSAYTILAFIKPEPKYYPYIREMVEREQDFYLLEQALYRFASYKKAVDVDFIKQTLLKNRWRFSDRSFSLMQEYPNEAYLDVLGRYARSNLHHDLSTKNDTYKARYFFYAIASYKSERSAAILDSILNYFPFTNCTGDSSSKEDLRYAIWQNQCPAYGKMISEIKPFIREYEKKILPLQPLGSEELDFPKRICWYCSDN